MLAAVKWDEGSGRCAQAGLGRSGSGVLRQQGKCGQYNSPSGIPLPHIGRSPTQPNEHFVLLFKQMLASGHHSDYDAPT
jgi:hypothetical protein